MLCSDSTNARPSLQTSDIDSETAVRALNHFIISWHPRNQTRKIAERKGCEESTAGWRRAAPKVFILKPWFSKSGISLGLACLAQSWHPQNQTRKIPSITQQARRWRRSQPLVFKQLMNIIFSEHLYSYISVLLELNTPFTPPLWYRKEQTLMIEDLWNKKVTPGVQTRVVVPSKFLRTCPGFTRELLAGWSGDYDHDVGWKK